MEGENAVEDLLYTDAKEAKIAANIFKQRLVLIALILVLIFVTAVASFALYSFYEKIQAWNHNGFELALKERHEKYEHLKSATDTKMGEFSKATFSLEPMLDNTHEILLMNMLVENEKENRNFLKEIVKAAHKVAVQVRGARTWYEQYSDKLDRLVNSSHLKQRIIGDLQKGEHPLYKLPPDLIPDNLEIRDEQPEQKEEHKEEHKEQAAEHGEPAKSH